MARCREAGIPTQVGFATKLDEAYTANVPFGRATMDGGYGQYPQVRNWLAAHSLPYVVASSAALPLAQISVLPGATAITRADGLLSRLVDGGWQRRSCGEGSKGQRFYDWASETPADRFAHTLLLRRSITDPDDVTHFLAHAPDPSPAGTLVRIAGTRWKIRGTAKWQDAAVYALRMSTSYRAIDSSRETRVRPSTTACATSMRSNGSRW